MRLNRLIELIATLTVIAVVSGCNDDTTGPDRPAGAEVGVVVNSIELSLTVFPVDSPTATRTIGLAQAGSPVGLALRGRLAVVPLGFISAAAVVDLATESVRTIPLPDNSGATGVAFVDDSIVYVANPSLNTVSVLNVAAGTAGPEIPVGVFPHAIVVVDGRAFVLNAELDADFQPARPGRVSVIDTATDSVVATIALSGLNPAAGALGPDGRLYIINSGSYGQTNGSLSVVDPATLAEVEHYTGFGAFPGAIAFDSRGRAYVASFFYGIAVWDAAADSFVRPPSDPLVVQGNGVSSAVGFDSADRLYSLVPGDCQAPSVALRLNPDLSFDTEIDVGVCPIAIGFTRIEAP